MSRRPFNHSVLATRLAARHRRRRPERKSERLIRRLLLAWLLLLGGTLLTQAFPFPGSAQLGYGLVVAVALGSPVVGLLLLWWVVLGLYDAYYRLRVLRRAAKWSRQVPSDAWMDEEWTRSPR